jgi:23S rRNA pseudouridine2605 synthase
VERIHKCLANAGLGSRRAIEKWIQEGKVKVDGSVAEIGQLVSARNKIHVNGKLISLEEKRPESIRVIMYHKPEGEICSHARVEGKKTVFSSLPPLSQGKWIMVGRLDINTSGLLLFTNQGELANRLMHPRFEIEREYAVRVLGRVTENTLARLKKGVMLEEGLARFQRIIPHDKTESSNQWFDVTLSEGRYREVRRLWESQGCIVSRLIRIRYGTIQLSRRLRKGCWEEIPLHAIEAMTGVLAPCTA